ncbi:MAG TPA: hypothetical protein VN799_06760 [Acidimicrobiales bacterium]|nr:hypothetical protein [Acidimicrobiales bacterium]
MESSPDTVEASVPNAVFSPDDDLETLWFKAYQGEVSGETLFATIARVSEDPEIRRKMTVLARLEKKTREACVPAMVRNGFPTDPDPKTVADAESLGEVAAAIPWTDLMASFEPITSQFVVLYKRIGEVSAADRAESELLVAHEHALLEFARREIAGRSDDSTEPIEALPHMN